MELRYSVWPEVIMWLGQEVIRYVRRLGGWYGWDNHLLWTHSVYFSITSIHTYRYLVYLHTRYSTPYMYGHIHVVRKPVDICFKTIGT